MALPDLDADQDNVYNVYEPQDFVDETFDFEGVPKSGNDAVNAWISFSFVNPAQCGGILERLVLQGDEDLFGVGNDVANELVGNFGDNVLDGGLGADLMAGGFGDDIYFVDDAGDQVHEDAGRGTDSVWSSVSLTLAANVENLELFGADSIDGIGNNRANSVVGNDAANVLNGLHKSDILEGGMGNDSFAFSTALKKHGNVDTILDFSPEEDTIVLDHAIFANLTPGALAANVFRVGEKAKNGDDFIVYNDETGALIYDKNGSQKGGAVEFANVGDGLELSSADFFVV